MPRAGAGPGGATFMRLPAAESGQGLDVAVLGIPFDAGASHRAGTRFGPRQIRQESAMLRPYNMATGAAPFERLQCADIGDVPVNPYHVEKTCGIITEFMEQRVLQHGATPLTMGGDHTLTLPILRALRAAGSPPLGLVHVDAHADVNDEMFGERVAHGTPFRRAVEEGLLDCNRVVQIGLRGTGYGAEDFGWCRDQGFRVVQAEECWHKSLTPLMEEVRERVGDGPVYLSFDIDGLDPAFAPGTGTLEVGGLTVMQGLEIVRGMAGVNVVGADLVEVSPPYDMAGTTALVGANLLYEMLCILKT